MRVRVSFVIVVLVAVAACAGERASQGGFVPHTPVPDLTVDGLAELNRDSVDLPAHEVFSRLYSLLQTTESVERLEYMRQPQYELLVMPPPEDFADGSGFAVPQLRLTLLHIALPAPDRTLVASAPIEGDVELALQRWADDAETELQRQIRSRTGIDDEPDEYGTDHVATDNARIQTYIDILRGRSWVVYGRRYVPDSPSFDAARLLADLQSQGLAHLPVHQDESPASFIAPIDAARDRALPLTRERAN